MCQLLLPWDCLSGRITKICPVGLSESENTDEIISVYPNPTNGSFNINVTENMLSSNMKVTDVTGRVVYNTTINSLNTTIDLSAADKGVYLITLVKDSKEITQKIIVE